MQKTILLEQYLTALKILMNNQPILTEQFSCNGEFSHWHLTCLQTGMVLWSSYPEETVARGQKIRTWVECLAEQKKIEQLLVT